MNYRHAYHAGNFADVFKHILLIALIQSLTRKEAPMCYIDTHAGTGSYDLFSAAAQKSKEFNNGITKILAAKNTPDLITQYLSCIRKNNTSDKLRYYPGSPYCAHYFLRPQDSIILSELHAEDFQTLRHFFRAEKQISVHRQDGYQSLKAFLPPKERRGLVLIDPPYEKSDELSTLPNILAQAVKRWETGVYAVWFPIKNRLPLDRFYRELKTTIQRPFLTVEFCIYPDDNAFHLNGCGMIIINPPWQIDQHIAGVLPWLWKALRINNQGHATIV